MSPTMTETVYVKNRATGLVHGMAADSAAYYLSQIDPETGVALYERTTEPDAPASTFDPKAAKAEAEAAKHMAATIQSPEVATMDQSIMDSTRPYVPHGVPDAARMEVAVGASESGPTLRAESDRRAVIGGEDPQARQEEALAAADTSALIAELEARKASAERAGSKDPDPGTPASISQSQAAQIAAGDAGASTEDDGGKSTPKSSGSKGSKSGGKSTPKSTS